MEALLVGALCLVVGLIGRQVLVSTNSSEGGGWTSARGAGFRDSVRWPLGGGSSLAGAPQWASSWMPSSSSAAAAAASRRRPAMTRPYYLPAELGVHHYSILGAAGPLLAPSL